MKVGHSCPKCRSTRLWVISKVAQSDYPSTHSTKKARPVPVTAVELPAKGGFWSFDTGVYSEVGTFEAWICAQCGFTEWYAKGVNEALAKLAEHPMSGVRLIDSGAPQSPYR